MFDGKSVGTWSKPTSRHTSVNSSTLPEHLQPRNSQTAQIFLTDKPYEPYCFSALSYNSCASRSEFVDGMTTVSRIRPSSVVSLWPAAVFIDFVVLIVTVGEIGAVEYDSMAIVDANGIRDEEEKDDANVDNEDDGTLWAVNGRNDVDEGGDNDDDDDGDDDSADVEMQ